MLSAGWLMELSLRGSAHSGVVCLFVTGGDVMFIQTWQIETYLCFKVSLAQLLKGTATSASFFTTSESLTSSSFCFCGSSPGRNCRCQSGQFYKCGWDHQWCWGEVRGRIVYTVSSGIRVEARHLTEAIEQRCGSRTTVFSVAKIKALLGGDDAAIPEAAHVAPRYTRDGPADSIADPLCMHPSKTTTP